MNVPPHRCPHCNADFPDATQPPGSMVLCAECGRNFILPAPREPLEPIFDAPAASPISIERKMLIAVGISWGAYILIIVGSVLSVLLNATLIQLAIGALIFLGYLPFLIVATVMGFTFPPSGSSRVPVLLCIVAMWLPMGLTALGMVLPMFRG